MGVAHTTTSSSPDGSPDGSRSSEEGEFVEFYKDEGEVPTLLQEEQAGSGTSSKKDKDYGARNGGMKSMIVFAGLVLLVVLVVLLPVFL
jgi:hypothetical protein